MCWLLLVAANPVRGHLRYGCYCTVTASSSSDFASRDWRSRKTRKCLVIANNRREFQYAANINTGGTYSVVENSVGLPVSPRTTFTVLQYCTVQ